MQGRNIGATIRLDGRSRNPNAAAKVHCGEKSCLIHQNIVNTKLAVMPLSLDRTHQSAFSDTISVEVRVCNVTPMAMAQLGRTAGFFKPEGRDYLMRTTVRDDVIISEDFMWILRRAMKEAAEILFTFSAKPEHVKTLALKLQLPETICLSSDEGRTVILTGWGGWYSRAARNFISAPKFPRSRHPR
jgi:hypothetical protein